MKRARLCYDVSIGLLSSKAFSDLSLWRFDVIYLKFIGWGCKNVRMMDVRMMKSLISDRRFNLSYFIDNANKFLCYYWWRVLFYFGISYTFWFLSIRFNVFIYSLISFQTKCLLGHMNIFASVSMSVCMFMLFVSLWVYLNVSMLVCLIWLGLHVCISVCSN